MAGSGTSTRAPGVSARRALAKRSKAKCRPPSTYTVSATAATDTSTLARPAATS
jgi:hypothetical protein